MGRLPCQNYGRWLCTAVGNTFGDAGRESFGGLRATDGGLSFDGLNAGVVGSEAVRGRGNLACAAMAPGLSLLGNNVQMEARVLTDSGICKPSKLHVFG